MGRLHLLELEDQPWFPAFLRDGMTDFLSFLGNVSPQPYVEFARLVAERMRSLGTDRVVDLCSGGGGPGLTLGGLLSEGGTPVTVHLTDIYPNLRRFEQLSAGRGQGVTFEEAPVDARDVPEHLDGFRVVFNGFHHFDVDDARGVLADAVRKSRGIAIYEMNGRSAPSLLSVLLSPVTLLLVTPFIRPLRLGRLLWTYVLPIMPLAVLWDGIVSCLRVYSPDELRTLVESVPGHDGFDWSIGQLPVPGTPAKATYLLGSPRP
jgi:hypothetical protein